VRVLARAMRWIVALIALGAGNLVDRLLRRASEDRGAERLCATIEGMGPVACKVARQFGHRLDLLPSAYALRLATLEDFTTPPPADVVVRQVEAAAKAPLERVFRAFDPTPLGSRTLRCTFQAELADGTPAIVRVLPPGMREAIAEEIAAIGLLLAVLEALTVVRPGFFRNLREEILDSLLEESDFRLHARAQNLLRVQSEEDQLSFVRTPRPYTHLTSDAVLVSARVDGLTLSEVIGLVQRGTEADRGRLLAAGIEPRKVARRLLQFAWWEIAEAMLFHSDPAPTDLVVAPGGVLVPVHFSDTSTTSNDNRRRLIELFRRLEEDDATAATEVLVQFAAPLPFIDTHAFVKRVEARLWHQLYALRDQESAWWERTSAGTWAALLDTTREAGVTVHQDFIHLVRALLAYETMALRLCPDLAPLDEYRRYQRRADARAARKFRKSLERDREHLPTRIAAGLAHASNLLQRAMFFGETALSNIPYANRAMPRKAAYAATVLLNLATTLGVLTVAGAAVLVAGGLAQGQAADPSGAVRTIVTHPAFGIVTVGLAVLALRRILFRLADNDPT
jgi:ubiquinone biosynthesis protein